MASISFTDATGSATLVQSDDGEPTARFNSWTPDPMPIGEQANGLGDGRLWTFEFRVDYKASFEMPRIPMADEAILQRFKLHAERGGFFTLTTDDSESNEYDECQRAPGTQIDIRLVPETLEYTLRMTAINMAASPVPLRCVYT